MNKTISILSIIIKATIVVIVATLLLSINIPTTQPDNDNNIIRVENEILNFPEEDYVDDIPFDTDEVIKNL